VADFNGDGIPDRAVAGTFVGDNTVYVRLGNADGTFQTARKFYPGIDPNLMAAADFNGDGKLDLVVNGGANGVTTVMLGNGDGSFGIARTIAVTFGPVYSMLVGDFNGDRLPDLVMANAYSGTVSVVLSNGDGTFRAARQFAAGPFPYSLAMGDFDGDGTPDLAVASFLNGNYIRVLLNNGDGSFQAPQSFLHGDTPIRVVVGDFNGDGKPDIAAVQYGSSNVSVLLNALVTTTTVSGPTSSTYGQLVTYTASLTSGGAPVTAGTVTFQDGDTPVSPALPLDANGQAIYSIASLAPGNDNITVAYSGTPGGVGTTGFGLSNGSRWSWPSHARSRRFSTPLCAWK
jgi:hypothetical protein